MSLHPNSPLILCDVFRAVILKQELVFDVLEIVRFSGKPTGDRFYDPFRVIQNHRAEFVGIVPMGGHVGGFHQGREHFSLFGTRRGSIPESRSPVIARSRILQGIARRQRPVLIVNVSIEDCVVPRIWGLSSARQTFSTTGRRT